MPAAEPDDLYGLPLEQFIPERGALAKALRQGGDRERAKEVTAMRKPSLAAWAVNQLVRTKHKEANELFKAGDALQQAQSELLEGRGDGKALRDAVARERHAVDTLSAQARGLLSADGHELTPATLEKVSDTLHAAALDPGAREQVEAGRLVRELRHVGMGPFGGTMSTAAPDRPKRLAAPTKPKGAEKEAKDAERRRAAALKAARQAERDARRAAARAERALEAAEARREDTVAALAEAEDAVAIAREQAERTARAHEQAEAEIERLTD